MIHCNEKMKLTSLHNQTQIETENVSLGSEFKTAYLNWNVSNSTGLDANKQSEYYFIKIRELFFIINLWPSKFEAWRLIR